MPLPQTVSIELLTELNAFVTRDEIPDPFTQARIKRKIQNLRNAAPAEAELCSAILHTINKNIDGVRNCYKDIFFYLPNDSDMHYNFAGSLFRLGYANEALDHFMQALAGNRVSREIVHEIANIANVTFRTDVLLNAIDMFIKASMDESISTDVEVQPALDLAALMQDLAIEPTTANKIYQAAECVILKFGCTVDRVRFFASEDFGGSAMSLYAGIVADPATVSEMNMALADEYVDRDLLHLLPQVTYAFTPAPETI